MKNQSIEMLEGAIYDRYGRYHINNLQLNFYDSAGLIRIVGNENNEEYPIKIGTMEYSIINGVKKSKMNYSLKPSVYHDFCLYLDSITLYVYMGDYGLFKGRIDSLERDGLMYYDRNSKQVIPKPLYDRIYTNQPH
jgi:hypothetical protein